MEEKFNIIKSLQKDIEDLQHKIEKKKQTIDVDKLIILNQLLSIFDKSKSNIVSDLFDGSLDINEDETIKRLNSLKNILQLFLDLEQNIKENMKHSQLRQIVKEEIQKAMDTFNAKVGVKPVTTSNKMKYETLPGYDALPTTRKEIDYKNRKSILLPSSFDSNASDELLSKEDVKKWYEDFKKKFNETPQFKIEGTKIKVLNGLKPDFQGMKDFKKGN